MVMTLALVLMGIAVPKVSKAMNNTRVNNAAAIIVADLQQGYDLARRARTPIRFTYAPSTVTYSFSNRSTGAVIRSRSLGSTSEFKLTTLTFSPTSVDFFPSGLSSGTLVVTLGISGYTRTVTATTAGWVRTTR